MHEKIQMRVAKVAECLLNLDPSEVHRLDQITSKTHEIMTWLEEAGIDDTEQGFELLMSEHCKFGYLKEIFVNKHNVPIIKFSVCWDILREDAQIPKDSYGAPVKTGQMSESELVGHYGPDTLDKIIRELEKRSKGRNCMVYDMDNKLHIDHSVKFLHRARKEDTPATFSTGDDVFRVLRVGVFPNVKYDICPVCKNVLIEHYCDTCGVTWKDINKEARQYIALLSDMFNISRSVPSIIHIINNDGFGTLKADYPKVTIKFNELKDDNNLPRLETKSSANKTSHDSPFHPTIKRSY